MRLRGVFYTPELLFPIFLSLQENSGPSIIASGTRSGVRGVQQNVYRSEQQNTSRGEQQNTSRGEQQNTSRGEQQNTI